MTTFLFKETITRLLKDVKQIIKNPLTDNGIHYIHDEVDMLKGYALIVGQPDTPYFGGNYFFELTYPSDYPHSPPKVKYWTNGNNIRFNPNLYLCGKVCISLLNTWRGDQWTSCQTISTVLLTLCTLLCSDPLLNEPGVDKKHTDLNSYDEIIQYANIDIAICDIIEKKPGVFVPFFENFYHLIKENFIKNYDKLLEFAEKKNIEFNKEAKNYKTGFYSMNVNVDYNKLIEKLQKTKNASQIVLL
jgi:ubiquitin-conjugating enzyme E2 Z